MKANREEKQRIAAVNNLNKRIVIEFEFFSIIWVLLKQHGRKKWNDQKQVMHP
jgi:hypothetical protein